jgi:hypothetical protein
VDRAVADPQALRAERIETIGLQENTKWASLAQQVSNRTMSLSGDDTTKQRG